MRGILASRSVRVKLNNELRVTRILCSIAALGKESSGELVSGSRGSFAGRDGAPHPGKDE
jgi:hypothetical protein